MDLAIFVITAVVLPLLISLHVARVTRHVTTSGLKGMKHFRAVYLSSWSISALIIACIIGFFVYWRSSLPPPPKLDFMRLDDFRSEIEHMRSLGQIQEEELKTLVRKFSTAERMFDESIYKEAWRVLTELDKGVDVAGQFTTVRSYTIKNNLGVVVFYIKKNQGFEALEHFFSARQGAGSSPSHLDRIRGNISDLDQFINHTSSD